MARLTSLFMFLTFLVLGIVFDWATKSWALASLMHPKVLLPGLLTLELERNTGIAFGLPLSNAVMIVVTPLLLILLFFFAKKNLDLTKPVALFFGTFIVSGGIGNFLDRIFRGAVVDFISLPYWPTFNIADMEVVLGVVGIALFYGRIKLTGRT